MTEGAPIHWIASITGVVLSYVFLVYIFIVLQQYMNFGLAFFIGLLAWCVVSLAIFIPMEKYDKKKYGKRA